MWSNISAPKSHLKSAQVGHQSSTSPTQTDQITRPTATASGSSPLMRYKHAVCASQTTGLIYIHGGRFGNGLQLDDDVWRFDPHENSWQQLNTRGCRPPSLQEHTLVEHQGYLYLFGGQVSAASGQENSFWRLDLVTNEWTSLNQKSSVRHGAYLGPLNRRGHSAVLHRDSMYIFGGYEDFRGSSSQLWQYDLLNERWELRNLSSSSACHPEPRHSHSAVVFDDSMFVFGGLSNLKPLGDLWRWSWRDKRWYRERTRGHSPGPLHGHSAIQAFGSMFVFGGERQNGRTTRSVWRLDLRNLCWHKIRPKGPRPNPTTWHVAVANPMDALDGANFLIEGDELADDQQQHILSEDQLCHQTATNSLSDNCFYASQASQQKETIPMETYRPIELNNRAMQTSQQKARDLKLTAPTASISDHQLNLQSNDKIRAKRKIRLNFFKRGNKTRSPSKRSKAMEFVRRKMPASWSAANIIATSNNDSLTSNQTSLVKRHSVELADSLVKQEGLKNKDIEMETQEELVANSRILDNLDTDIKQMFQSTQMNPSEEELNPNECEQIKQEVHEENEENSMTGDNNLDFSSKRPTRDSMTQSQLSSYATGVAPGSRLTLTSQSYRTAQEQLTSQSSDMTITAQPSTNDIERPVTSRLGEIKQRRSMHQFNRRSGGQERRARPKSEIVQSLIDRADARIKHFYTPLFQPEQQRTPFNATDPILGSLQNHPMFERSNRASGSFYESRSGRNQRSNSLVDKSKRHTIHQTTTYYNLYFGEDNRKPESNGRQVCDELTSASSATSTSTIKNASGANNRTATYVSTTAALVGVRDGSNESNTPRGDQPSRSGTNQDTDASLASSFPASSHQTITSQTLRADRAQPNEGSSEEDDLQEDYDRVRASYQSRQEENGRHQGGSEMEADNTSLSFSVIAEFEEDDMLQYSSPTDSERRRQSSVEYEDDELEDCAEDDGKADLALEHSESGQQRETHYDQMHCDRKYGILLKQQKSTSSGYDSIRSSNIDTNSPKYQNPCSDTNGISHYNSTNVKHLQIQSTANTNHKQYPTTTSTVESLHTLTNSSGCSAANSSSLMHSPPSKSLALSSSPETEGSSLRRSEALQTRSNSQTRQLDKSPASKLAARLFGKRRGAKRRYWQLCMFVMGGKQQLSGVQGSTGAYMSEPINIWRLYI